jgi:transposase
VNLPEDPDRLTADDVLARLEAGRLAGGRKRGDDAAAENAPQAGVGEAADDREAGVADRILEAISTHHLRAEAAQQPREFDVFQGTCDEIRVMDFLEKLLEHFPAREKIFLILDNARFHKTAGVGLWLEDHPRMELFFLPPYAPELNPDELLNQDVHAHVARRRPRDLETLVKMTVGYLATRTREIVSNYFLGEHVAYAR